MIHPRLPVILGFLGFLSACSPMDAPLQAPEWSATALLAGRTLDNAPLGLLGKDGRQGSVVPVQGVGLLSASHVAGPWDTLVVGFPSGRVPARVQGRREDLMQVGETGQPFPVLPDPYVPGPCPIPGSRVVLLGNIAPFRTEGEVLKSARIPKVGDGLILRAKVLPGFSGGAVLDPEGRLVGIISGRWQQEGTVFSLGLGMMNIPGCGMPVEHTDAQAG